MPKETYTLYADNGLGDFLCHKQGEEVLTNLVGGNYYCLWGEDTPDPIISKSLMTAFCDWARWYMDASKNDGNMPDLDWDAFNQTGMQLAQRLKDELGDSVQVFYLK